MSRLVLSQQPRTIPWTTLEQPQHLLLRGLRSRVPPRPLWSPVISALTPLCKGADPLPPHRGIQESRLLVSLSGRARSLEPSAPPGARFQNSSPLHHRSPGPLTGSGFGALPSALRRCSFCPLDRWLGKSEEREAALSPFPAARKWRGDNRSNSSRGRRERPACPARSRGIQPSRPHPRKAQHDDPPTLPPAPPFLPPGGPGALVTYV